MSGIESVFDESVNFERGDKMEKITLQIKGMSCSHCQNAVTKALQALEGVEKVDVHLEQGTADVTYDRSKVSVEQLKEAVEEQGYDVV